MTDDDPEDLHNQDESCSKNMLKICHDVKLMNEGVMRHTDDYFYKTQEQFFLDNGKEYKIDFDRLNDCGIGAPQHCFKNAADYVIRHHDFTYVEGYASTVIPTIHAWVVDKEGVIYDLTWESKRQYPPHCYFGVEIPTRILMTMLCETGTYGLIDSWGMGWPMLKIQYAPENIKTYIHRLERVIKAHKAEGLARKKAQKRRVKA